MRLPSDLVSRKLENLYARLNDFLTIFMKPGCGSVSENSKVKKSMSYRLTPLRARGSTVSDSVESMTRREPEAQIRAKFLLIPAVIVSVMLGACFTTLNGEEIKADDSSVEKANVYRNPFSLPSGVRFEKKKEEVGKIFETVWTEGVVASHVYGIFQSGNIARANINGIWVKEGDWVGEEQVTKIETEHVVLVDKEEERNLPLREHETEFQVIERAF